MKRNNTKKRLSTVVVMMVFALIGGLVALFGVYNFARAASTSDLGFEKRTATTVGVYASSRSISGDLVIPETSGGNTVTSIAQSRDGQQGFYWCEQLTSVVVPGTIEEFCQGAFCHCTNLKSVTLKDGITKIGSTSNYSELGVFESCINLKSVSIPNSVTSIGYKAFLYCENLTITYDGTKEEWDAIEKGHNAIPENTSIVFLREVKTEVSVTHSGENIVVTYSGYNAEGYYSKADSAYSSSSDKAFTSGTTFTEDGYYRIEIRSTYIETIVKYFKIDKLKLTVSPNISDYGLTNSNVVVTFSGEDAVGSYSSASGYFTAFSSGKEFTNDGDYIIKVKNSYKDLYYHFTIDKTPPVGALLGVSDGGLTNGTVKFSWSESGASAKLDGKNYSSNTNISTEGLHRIVLTDAAGNTSNYSFTIDTTAPKIGTYNAYVNSAFTLSATDALSGVNGWKYKLNDGAEQSVLGDKLTLGGGAESNGIWKVSAVDVAGNASAWTTINFAYRDTFNNRESIYNSFFTPVYYVVTLTQKNYPDCYGTYTFAEYEYALSFAVQKEWTCRVIELDGGTSWNYVTAANENTRQIYTDRSELDTVIEKYARKHVSDRKIMGKNGTVLNNPTDGNGATRDDALTMQVAELPDVLSAYSAQPYMLASVYSALSLPKSIVDGNTSRATIQFISDGISLRKGAEMSLEYGVALKNYTSEQGWYLITERDVCGNVEKYLIYIDMQQPDLEAAVTYGNGRSEVINFNQSYVDGNAQAMRYISFDVRTLSDNIDEFAMLMLSGRNLDDRFVVGDEIPVLNYENGYYGAYTVTAYDRSHNVIEFEIYIAGEDPSLKHTSLTNETSCTFTVQINDGFNEITDIKFFKVHYDGTEERLDEDSFGTEVCSQNLVYKLNVGGKYKFEFTDLYGRIVYTNPLFYMKGLPSATLRGVKDGGRTKNDVSIIYELNATAELYVMNGEEWIFTSCFELSQSISSNTMSIAAGSDTTAYYKVFLYITEDRNLFTEYTFEIDGIPPIVEIYTENGTAVAPETVTTQNFYVVWQESGYLAYYKKRGAISDTAYAKGTRISAAGTYVFTFYDEVRNELTFTVTLDNVVSYTLDSTSYLQLEDGSYITRGSFVFTMDEPWSEFSISASNGLTAVNGQKLETHGTYSVNVKDPYGNALSLTLIVDKLPPVPVIRAADGVLLSDGDSTSKAFSVSCEEDAAITYLSENGVYLAYDGTVLDEPGSYTFKLADIVGNVAMVTVTIDRDVLYRLDGNFIPMDGKYYSRLWFQVVAREDMSVFTIEAEDGTLIDNTKRITAEGEYSVLLVDLAGNEKRLTLIIDKTAPTVRLITVSGKLINGGEATNEPFRIECDELDVRITYSFNKTSPVAYDGGYLAESGSYTLYISDFLGTTVEMSLRFDKAVFLKVNGTYVIDENGNYVSRNWLSVSAGEEMLSFSLRSENGTMFSLDSRILAEGEYAVRAINIVGNVTEFSLIIDKTPPVILLESVSASGAANGAVTVNFRDYVGATYNVDGNKIAVQDGTVFEAEGKYTITAYDLVGNTVSVIFVIDKHVDASPSIELVDGQIITDAVSFSFDEPVTAILNHDGLESRYLRGAIAEPGEYMLYVTDEVGNERIFNWTIVQAKAREYLIQLNDGMLVTVELNSAIISTLIESNIIRLTQTGAYTLQFKGDSVSWILELEVDNVAPILEFKNTRKSVIISNPNKSNLTYTLYRDGVQSAFSLINSTEITKTGSYRLVCVDDVGNVTEYNFNLNYLSDVSIALIVIVSCLTLIGIVAIITVRFTRRRF